MEQYKNFQESLTKLPEAFKKTNPQIKQLEKMFHTVANSVKAVGENVKKSTSYMEKFNQLTTAAVGHFQRLDDRLRPIAGRILAMTKSFAAWSGLGMAAGGVLSGLGLEHLAAGMHNTRMRALGTGVSPAEQRAFELTYGRQIGGGGDILSSIAQAKMQPGSEEYANLYSLLGKDAMQGSTADIAKALVDRTRQLYKSGQHIAYGDVLSGAGMTPERVRAIGSMSNDEYNRNYSKYGEYTSKFALSDETMRKFQRFDEALEAAGTKIRNAFVTGIDKLVGEDGPLVKLADAFSDMVQKVLGSEGFAWAVGKVRDALNAFANWIASDDFKKDVKDFMDGVKVFIDGLRKIAEFLGLINARDNGQPKALSQNGAPADSAASLMVMGPGGTPQQQSVTVNASAATRMAAQGMLPGGVTPQEAARLQDAISKIEGNYGSIGPVANSSGDRAYGKYQVMGSNIPAWTKEFLGKNMTPQEFLADKDAQDAVFMGQMTKYRNKYGSWEAASRAWFAGEGGMNDPNRADVLGTTVERYGRMFAQNFGEGAYGNGQRPGVNVTINNNTPNQVVAQVGAAAPVANPSANAPLQVGNPIPPPSSYARLPSQ